MRANRHTREAVARGVEWTAYCEYFGSETAPAVHGEPVGVRAMVGVRQLVRCGVRRPAPFLIRGGAVVEPIVTGLRRDRVAVVNVRQEPFDGCHHDAEERNECAHAAEQEAEWLSPTRHDTDT